MIGVLVLAAGNSTRIARISQGLPKPLLEIEGKSIIVRNLEWLASHGVRSAWINLHYRGDLIKHALGDGSRLGMSLRYSVEPTILGTAGAWKRLEAEWDDTSLVVYGDNLMRFDLERFRNAHGHSSGVLASVALFDPARHVNTGIAGGLVQFDDEHRITHFVEGAPLSQISHCYVNAGAYLLEPELAEFVAPGFQDFGKDVFGPLAGTGRLRGHVIDDDGFCLGLDTPETFAVAQDLIASAKVALR